MEDHRMRAVVALIEQYAKALKNATPVDTRVLNFAESLNLLDAIEEKCKTHREHLVAVMRAEGKSWEQVGNILGMTRQSAWELYH
jgi:hypothetical protein